MMSLMTLSPADMAFVQYFAVAIVMFVVGGLMVRVKFHPVIGVLVLAVGIALIFYAFAEYPYGLEQSQGSKSIQPAALEQPRSVRVVVS